MDLDQLQKKLIAGARVAPPDGHVPYAFETRILAILRSVPCPDPAMLWERALWRSAAGCLGIALLFGILTQFAPKPVHNDLSLEFENTMLAAVDQESEAPW